MGALGSKSKLKTENQLTEADNTTDRTQSLKPRFRSHLKKSHLKPLDSVAEVVTAAVGAACPEPGLITPSTSSMMGPEMSSGDAGGGLGSEETLQDLMEKNKLLEAKVRMLEDEKRQREEKKAIQIEDLKRIIENLKVDGAEKGNEIVKLKAENEDLHRFYEEKEQNFQDKIKKEFEDKISLRVEEFENFKEELEKNAQCKCDLALHAVVTQLTHSQRRNAVLQDLFESLRQQSRQSRPEDAQLIAKLQSQLQKLQQALSQKKKRK